ncbi:hypothetical protein E5720_12395 [Rhodococcus sp. PAMC28707]|uniref:DUF6779 domain-containing protein n=1 Tax=unclassified Rhodococcus (in: high G+C Gram-positive bacteria) TaxID=192944 RepID=UPI00109E2DCA|nr:MULTISPECIES: DUF6779 domain-containing protein [unclassified Rhodococcus (in: high G+C Gram-positive bacteria)]QCB49135.1 hypothetical protein E5769_01620 [Rhodococcus sp. PAMC28705]QCB59177.1 hypothetical protein E5720_12395 [Rhodococcus sp. PAMC28707]
MTEPTRAKASRRQRRSASQLFIAALVVFGIIASMLMLFSENVQWLRVGLVSALWAAIIGAFAMTKYRREAVADQTRAKDLQTVYELQLAREISARREYELGVESRVRSEVAVETSEIAALRAELAHLRNNLQLLFDGNLPTERVALRADATRVQELGGRSYASYQPAPSGLFVPGKSSQSSSPSTEGPNAPVPGLGTPYDEPVTAETSVLYPDVPIGSEDMPGVGSVPNGGYVPSQPAPRAESRSEGSGRRVPTPPHSPTPTPPLVSEPVGYSSDRTKAVEAEEPLAAAQVSGASSQPSSSQPSSSRQPSSSQLPYASRVFEPEVVPESTEQPAPVPEEAMAPAPDSNTEDVGSHEDSEPAPDLPRRRRRAEPDGDGAGAHSNGRSVAEIMAGMKSSDTEPSARRHRRRAD